MGDFFDLPATPDSSRPKMNLLNIPNEILHQIATCLDYDSDISALSQTCKDLHSIADRILAPRKPTDPQSSHYLVWLKHLLTKRDVDKLHRLLTSTIKLPQDENIVGFVSTFAVKRGYLDIVRLVVDNYPSCLTQTYQGMSLTKIAVKYHHSKINSFLTSRGCLDPRPENRQIFNALDEGSLSKFRHAIEVLNCPIDSATALTSDLGGIFVAGVHFASRTPLWVAAYKGQLDIVKYLINLGADTSIRSDPVPALFAAAMANRSKVVIFLLESSAHPDLQKIGCHAWRILTDCKNRMTDLLIERLDIDALTLETFKSVDSADSKRTEYAANNLVRFAIGSGKKEFMTRLFQGSHSAAIRKAISGSGYLLEPLVRNGCIQEADLIMASLDLHKLRLFLPHTLHGTIDWVPGNQEPYGDALLLKYFYERTEDFVHAPGITLKNTTAQNNGAGCFPESAQNPTNQAAVFKKLWMQLFNSYSIRGDVLQAFINLGFLQYLTKEEVKHTFQCICIHGSRASLQILLQVLPQFGLCLDSSSEPGDDPTNDWRYYSDRRYRSVKHSPEPRLETLFEYALYGCPSKSLFSLLARPDMDLRPTNKTCLKIFALAVCNCRNQTVEWFLNNGFAADMKYGEGDVPLLCLAAQSRFHVANTVDLLLERGVSADATDSALFHAAKYGKTRMVRTLLAHGADPLMGSHRYQKPPSKYGTPLGRAILRERVEIVKMFLETLESRRVRIDWLLSLVPPGTGTNDLEIAKALTRSHWRMAYPVTGP
ncbi:hypothetical protein N7451_006425 [Penicillium sp. IBT 35674x]|nr:hypothetical protein N7451_006425 [Penicillium sp. IBT 35674x]